MEHLAKVRDGSKGDVGDNLGYWGCMAVACESGGRRPIPLHFRLWSADSPGFVSENDEVEGIVRTISRHTKRRGIYVYDGGGDNIEFYRFLLAEGLDFIVRLKERYVRSWKRTVMCGELAWQCRMLLRPVRGRKGTRGVALRVLRAEHRMTADGKNAIFASGKETPPRSRSRICT